MDNRRLRGEAVKGVRWTKPRGRRGRGLEGGEKRGKREVGEIKGIRGREEGIGVRTRERREEIVRRK